VANPRRRQVSVDTSELRPWMTHKHPLR